MTMEANTLTFLFLLVVGSISCWGDENNQYGPPNYSNGNTDNGYYQQSQPEYNGGEQSSQTYQEQQNYEQQDAGSNNNYYQPPEAPAPAYYNGEQSPPTYEEQPSNTQQDAGTNYYQQAEAPAPAYDNGEQSSPTYQEQPSNTQQDTGNKPERPKVDLSHFNIGLLLGGPVDFDGDNDDIDDFDFELDELDRETDIDINANKIRPVDWVPLLENYVAVLSKGKNNAKSKYKIRKANELKNLEEELVRREKEDFEDEEPEKETCAKMEYNLLTHIHSLPVDQQKVVLDVDRDGVPDFDFVDVHDKLGFKEENN